MSRPPSISTLPTAGRYSATAIALHWIIAILIVAGFALGLYMSDLPFSPSKLKYISWHKWIGVTVFMLLLVRLAWRLTHVPPPAMPQSPLLERLASLTHLLLYGLMLIVPLSGWIYSSATGVPTVWLGLVRLPDLIAANPALKAPLREVHEVLTWTLAALVALHTAAALKHQFIDRDRLLGRMLPFLNR